MFRKIFVTLVLGGLLAACGAVQPAATQTPGDAAATNVAQYVEQTRAVQQVVETQVEATHVVAMTETATSQPTATATPIPASATPEPTATNTPLPTSTATPTATSTPSVCNAAQFIADLTGASGDVFPTSTRFSKVWRIKNIGSCTWTKDYEIVYDSGDRIGGMATALPKKVAPGETVDITMLMKTPDTKGTYKGYWILRDAEMVRFGLGYGTKTPVEVKIKVVNAEAVHSYDFAANFCQATWKTDAATLYCDGNSAIYKDTVRFANNFQLENDKWEDEPAILVNVSKEERVRGIYPSYAVQTGDRFVAQIGCVEGSLDCKMEMRILYQVKGGSSGELGEWIEQYDGKLTLIDVDLSAFAGKEVYFILDMESKSTSSENQVFWFVPSIRNP